jgi:hypothetical protein
MVGAEEQFKPGSQRRANIGLCAATVASVSSGQRTRCESRAHVGSFLISPGEQSILPSVLTPNHRIERDGGDTLTSLFL